MKLHLLILIIAIATISCKKNDVAPPVDDPIVDNNESNEGELIFQSGFEPQSTVVAQNSDADIIGKDNSFPSHNNWVDDLDNHPDIGNFNLQYLGGNDSQRFAKIIAEPGNLPIMSCTSGSTTPIREDQGAYRRTYTGTKA